MTVLFKMSITKRWLLSTIFVIALILALISALISLFFRNYYYESVKLKIESIGQSAAISNFFSSYLNAGTETFENGARLYVESFDYGNLCEVWVLDGSGRVVVTSTGFHTESGQYPDYETALLSQSGKGDWIGNLQSGERVYVLSVLLPRTDGQSNGAVRLITSLEDIDRQWRNMTLLISFICIFALLLVFMSGLFFIRSIVRPVRELSKITKQIAAGDFSVRAEAAAHGDEITELCRSINDMSEEISRTDKLKNDFISTVSHELRTPLTAIKGWSETLRLEISDENELLANGLQVISNETERLYSLVEDLLDFSKMESGRMSLRMTMIDVLAELDMAVYVLADRAKREGIDIEYTSPEFAAPMMGDADRIKQVFVNLIDNAVKYSPIGSVVQVEAIRSGNELIISIRDHGCGISEEDLPRIKEKFYKSNLSAKGSGIGLAVCDEIITRHAGSLEISSRLQVGTLVVVRLPLKIAAEEGKDI